jgi:peptidoglycan-N-acetylglucosamine deacetylase
MWNPLRHASAFRAAQHHLLGTITHVQTEQRVAALTFDDGPDPEFTPQTLQVLREAGARATFFVVGKRAEKHPELIEQILRDGHLLGNHSWSHIALPLLSRAERLHDIIRCHNVLPKQPKRLLRPPHGWQNHQSRLDAQLLGYDVVTWNAAGDDWSGAEAGAISARLLDEIQPGSIVLLHDSLYKTLDVRYRDRRPMLEALQNVFSELASSYQFVTVSELLEVGKPQKSMWVRLPKTDLLEKLITAE